jgi:hypothetical protein
MRAKTFILTLILAGCSFDDALEEHDESSVSDAGESTAAPTHDPTGPNCPGGSGGPEPGGGPGRGKPIPAPRDCTKEPTPEQCYLCCDWNEKNVWGETCRRIKNKEERRACWWRLENTLRPQCQRGCGPITTVAP